MKSPRFGSDKAGAQAKSRRTTRYFEMFGNRGVYHDGWMASTRHGRLPWQTMGHATGDFDADKWELYHVAGDFSQAEDLVAQHPRKVKELRRQAGRRGYRHLVYQRQESGGGPGRAHHDNWFLF